MSDQPSTDNSAAEAVNAAIRRGNSLGVQLVMKLAIADQPWLGLPGIKQAFGLILGWLDGYLSKAEQAGATFLIIDGQVDHELTSAGAALAALKAALALGDPAKIAAAQEAYEQAEAALDHSDGSAVPK